VPKTPPSHGGGGTEKSSRGPRVIVTAPLPLHPPICPPEPRSANRRRGRGEEEAEERRDMVVPWERWDGEASEEEMWEGEGGCAGAKRGGEVVRKRKRRRCELNGWERRTTKGINFR